MGFDAALEVERGPFALAGRGKVYWNFAFVLMLSSELELCDVGLREGRTLRHAFRAREGARWTKV